MLNVINFYYEIAVDLLQNTKCIVSVLLPNCQSGWVINIFWLG